MQTLTTASTERLQTNSSFGLAGNFNGSSRIRSYGGVNSSLAWHIDNYVPAAGNYLFGDSKMASHLDNLGNDLQLMTFRLALSNMALVTKFLATSRYRRMELIPGSLMGSPESDYRTINQKHLIPVLTYTQHVQFEHYSTFGNKIPSLQSTAGFEALQTQNLPTPGESLLFQHFRLRIAVNSGAFWLLLSD